MQICKGMNLTYTDKNDDYGDSFARVRKEEGEASLLVRIKDKVYRLETLLHGKARKVTDETIEDTLIDLANYCIMELVERRYDEEVRRQMCIASSEDVENHSEEGFKCERVESDMVDNSIIAVKHAEHFWESK